MIIESITLFSIMIERKNSRDRRDRNGREGKKGKKET